MLRGLLRSVIGSLWLRFSLLGLIGKAVTVVVVCFAAGWSLASIGLDAAGREVWSAGILVLSLLLTGVFIKSVWGRAGRQGR